MSPILLLHERKWYTLGQASVMNDASQTSKDQVAQGVIIAGVILLVGNVVFDDVRLLYDN
jgi:hypothetical protein